jgi:hypothetical protein
MERTAEYRVTKVNKEGKSLDYNTKTHNQGGRSSTFSQDKRFKEPTLYCQHTGESAYLGPGTYDPQSNFN